MSAKLISVIGPPAVGKTILAEHLAAELPATLIREDYAGNPFLTQSYVGAEPSRLPSQLYFILSRVAQLWEAQWPADGLIITDYGFCQDPIFARQRLGDEDLRVYLGVLDLLGNLAHRPDLIIRLDACEQTLTARIAARGRAFEKAMTRQFLSDMRAAYNTAAGRQDCPVIEINCDTKDVRQPGVRGELLTQIRRVLP